MENNLDPFYDMLIKYGARFNIYNNQGGEVMLTAVTKQNISLCEKLLKNGMTRNTKEYQNPSASFIKAIDLIIQNDSVEIYDLLKKYFDNMRILIKLFKETVIHDAIYNRSYKMLENLVRDGININTSDNLGNFPIHAAAQIGDDRVLSYLLRKNASVNAKNQDHQTALHLAAQNGHKDVFDTLQEHRVMDSVDRNNKTAEDYAKENGHYKELYINYHDKRDSMYS